VTTIAYVVMNDNVTRVNESVRCANCGYPIGMYVAFRCAVTAHNHEFCSECCVLEWEDAVGEAMKEKENEC
jgi:hypothetical protein